MTGMAIHVMWGQVLGIVVPVKANYEPLGLRITRVMTVHEDPPKQ